MQPIATAKTYGLSSFFRAKKLETGEAISQLVHIANALRDGNTHKKMPTTINQSAAQAAICYYIRAEYFYYTGTCYAPIDGPLTDGYGQRLEFSSREGAAAYLCESTEFGEGMGCEKESSGRYSFAKTYILRHGEYGRPRYAIRKVSSPRRKNP